MGIQEGVELNLSRLQMMQEMGIAPLWRLRCRDALPDVPGAEGMPQPVDSQSQIQSVKKVVNKEVAPSSAPDGIASLDWENLERCMSSCHACPLHEHRRQVVAGVGDRKAEWLFVGEGPGAEEDARGEPFVGQAGKLLDSMLAAIGLRRGDGVYIANAVKCRPPGNRTPEADEINCCRPFLEHQIELITPRLIVLLGRSAAHSVLHDERGTLASLRGKRFEYKGIPVVVTYHPAYLLRNLPEKSKVWEDLLLARRTMEAAKTQILG